jgi:Ca-activated chloride channel homolog
MPMAHFGIAAKARGVLLLAGAVITAYPLLPQEPKVSIESEQTVRKRPAPKPSNARIDVNQVLVPVSVMDAKDRPVINLPPDSFRVFEDDVEQKVVSVFREEGPVSVGFVFDASSSMANRMDRSVAAMQQFFKSTMPGDEFFLLRFSDRPTLVTNFTSDSGEILSELSAIQPQGWTALNDAIVMAIQRMKSAKNPRRALFVLTDGGDNNSRYTQGEVRSLVRESDVRIYAIGLFERPRFLEKLAADSGGTAFWAHKLKDLPETVDKLSQEFRNQYVLGYASRNRNNDGKYRRVRVELLESIRRMPLRVFWRRGYYAPPD